MKNFSKELILEIASKMYYDDGTFYSEKYSSEVWKARGWPEVDGEEIYRMLDAHIKLLREFDKYSGEHREQWNRQDILGRIKKPRNR